MEAKLGQRARDIVTGTEGIITARAEYLNGCVRYCVQPQVSEAHQIADKVEWVDHQQLQVLDDGVRGAMCLDGPRNIQSADVGGPPKMEAPRS